MGYLTIVVYSSHSGLEGIEVGWCKEVADAIQIVVRCSMDPATLDKQVDHIHGLQGAVAVEVGMDYQLEGEGTDYQLEEVHGTEEASAVLSRGEAEHNLAAQEVGSRVFEDVDQFAVVNQIFDFDFPQKDSCTQLSF